MSDKEVGRKLVFCTDDDHVIVIEKIINKYDSEYADLQPGEIQLRSITQNGQSTIMDPAIPPSLNDHTWDAIVADPSFWVPESET